MFDDVAGRGQRARHAASDPILVLDQQYPHHLPSILMVLLSPASI
jgi:hypothetical protein